MKHIFILFMLIISLPILGQETIPGGSTGGTVMPGLTTFSDFFPAGKTIRYVLTSNCSRSSLTASVYIAPNDWEPDQQVVNLRPQQSYSNIHNCPGLPPINWSVLVSVSFEEQRYDPHISCGVMITWASYISYS